jgi:hypothetical protein
MISDKEARQYILQQLYDAGYRYLARDENAFLYAYKHRPVKEQNIWSDTNFISSCVLLYNFLCFKDIKWADDSPLSIAKELGIIDWTKVPKDTKVLVWDEGGRLKNKRYFSHYEASATNFPFRVYCDGATSWSNTDEAVGYQCCELFNEVEEQDHD